MDTSNFGQADLGDTPAAPPPSYQGDVWPPPPVGAPTLATCYPFRFLYRRVQGNVADFREGAIGLEPEGVTIQGKAVPRAEIQALVLIPCILLNLLLALVARLVMEYGFRRAATLMVPWERVRQVALVPSQSRACIVYDAPNHAGRMKTFSLAFALDAGVYDAFVAATEQYIPGRVAPGRLRSGTSLVVWFFVILLVIVLIAAVMALVLSLW